MSWEAIGILVTLLTGVVSYTVKKYVDWKVDKALAGQLDILRKAHVERFDAVVRIKGMLAEINHCMDHIFNGHKEYSQRCKDWCMKVRQDARSMIALLGDDLVKYITALTDIALEYSDKPSTDSYDQWKKQLADMDLIADLQLRILKGTATANNSLALPQK